MTTPPPTSPPEELPDQQWESALRRQPLPNTPADILELASAVRQSLKSRLDALEPSAEHIDQAWQQVLAKAHAQGLIQPSVPWWQRLLGHLPQPRVLVPVLMLGVLASVFVVINQPSDEQTYRIQTVRGTWVVTAADANAPEPVAVQELLGLGIAVSPVAGQPPGLFELTWPAAPTPAQMAWLQKHALQPPPAGVIRLQLVK